MNITREHLAGLELALDIVRARSLIRKTGMIDGNNLHATLSDLIAQAQAAPVAEAVACWLKSNHPGADFVVIGNPEDIHAAATDLKIPLYTHPHDAELVELLRSKFPRIDPCAPVPIDEKAHCCEYTIYVERERLHREIDAYLSTHNHV